MKLRNIVVTTLLLTLVLTSMQRVLAVSCPEENNQDDRPMRYKWRGDRCEGLVSYPASGAPEIISVAINSLRTGGRGYGRTSVVVKSFSGSIPTKVSVHAFLSNEKYVMDNFTAKSAFNWNTAEVMQKTGVKPEYLSALAFVFTGEQYVYLPVVLGGNNTSYEFVLRANADIQLSTLEIRSSSNKLIRKLNTGGKQPKRRSIVRRWDGTDSNGNRSSRGQYSLVYSGYYEQRDGRPVPFSDLIRFEHDPRWLTP